MKCLYKVAKGLPKPAIGIIAEVPSFGTWYSPSSLSMSRGSGTSRLPLPGRGPQFKRFVPAPASPLRSKLSKQLEDKAASTSAALDDPELRDLEKSHLNLLDTRLGGGT